MGRPAFVANPTHGRVDNVTTGTRHCSRQYLPDTIGQIAEMADGSNNSAGAIVGWHQYCRPLSKSEHSEGSHFLVSTHTISRFDWYCPSLRHFFPIKRPVRLSKVYCQRNILNETLGPFSIEGPHADASCAIYTLSDCFCFRNSL